MEAISQSTPCARDPKRSHHRVSRRLATVDFKGPYLQAMREQAPKMFMQFRKAGLLDQHVQAKSVEAHQMLDQLLAEEPKTASGAVRNPEALARAEEIVRDQLIEFPTPESGQNPEPPNDLPRSASQIATSRAQTTTSNPARSPNRAAPKPRLATTSLR